LRFPQTDYKVDYHRIPNFEFGTVGTRQHLHIFFPKLWAPDSDRKPRHLLKEHERALWYENGLRPAISTLLGPNIASQWPATYETERIRAQKNKGAPAWQTKVIPREMVDLLADAIRTELDRNASVSGQDISWARDFFVLHTIRGLKDGSFHTVNPESADWYLTEFIIDANLSFMVPEIGEWYIDVAIEISDDDGSCLQWETAAHHAIVQQALRISDHNAQRITKIGSSKYSRDLSSHLTEVSGFRINPGIRARGEFEAVYLQAYTTDKAIVYNPEAGHHAKYITTKDAMDAKQPPKVIDGLFTIYHEAIVANSSNARLEVRVPYKFAKQALLEFEPNVLKTCLVSFSRTDWW
jgi:hypothetical protein